MALPTPTFSQTGGRDADVTHQVRLASAPSAPWPKGCVQELSGSIVPLPGPAGHRATSGYSPEPTLRLWGGRSRPRKGRHSYHRRGKAWDFPATIQRPRDTVAGRTGAAGRRGTWVEEPVQQLGSRARASLTPGTGEQPRSPRSSREGAAHYWCHPSTADPETAELEAAPPLQPAIAGFFLFLASS